MTQSASQAAAWRTDVRASGRVWTVEDDDGIPAPIKADGRRAMPLWSTRKRVEKIIASVPDYANLRPLELSLEEFGTQWLDGLERDGLLVGINWSGAAATGYDVEPADVREWLRPGRRRPTPQAATGSPSCTPAPCGRCAPTGAGGHA